MKRYKYNKPLTDTIADDSNNILLITISALAIHGGEYENFPKELIFLCKPGGRGVQ